METTPTISMNDDLAMTEGMSTAACLALFVLVVHIFTMAMVLLCCRPAPEEIAAHDTKKSWIINFSVQHGTDDDDAATTLLDDASYHPIVSRAA